MIVLFTISGCVLMISGCITSSIDPVDPMMRAYKNGNISVYSYIKIVSHNARLGISTAIIVRAMLWLLPGIVNYVIGIYY
jgi:hypothetical protein